MVDPDHDWLSREWLELHVIVNIAHGRAAEDWPISTTPLLPRFRALKDPIDSRNLKVLPGTPGNPNANFMSRASLSNLCTFAYAGVRRDDPSWAWLRDFCLRWNEVRSGSSLALNGLGATRKRGRAPTKREQTCAKMLRDIKEHGC
jgi:hypothetical protein